MALQQCPSCARHVRETEAHCPFCDATLAFVPLAPRANARLSRAAQMAIVAAVAIGCEETKPANDPTNASPPPVTTIEPPPAGTTTATTAATDAGPPNSLPPPDIAKPYGAPPADGLIT